MRGMVAHPPICPALLSVQEGGQLREATQHYVMKGMPFPPSQRDQDAPLPVCSALSAVSARFRVDL
jgi:hypothetical protein